MSNELKHAAVICHMAKHGFASVEGRLSARYPFAVADYACNPVTHPDWEWRIKPATITYTVPAPMREMPEVGERYSFICGSQVLTAKWACVTADTVRFNAGNCWATEADAQAAFDTIFGPLRGEE
jgi:hypothetical protein